MGLGFGKIWRDGRLLWRIAAGHLVQVRLHLLGEHLHQLGHHLGHHLSHESVESLLHHGGALEHALHKLHLLICVVSEIHSQVSFVF